MIINDIYRLQERNPMRMVWLSSVERLIQIVLTYSLDFKISEAVNHVGINNAQGLFGCSSYCQRHNSENRCRLSSLSRTTQIACFFGLQHQVFLAVLLESQQ